LQVSQETKLKNVFAGYLVDLDILLEYGWAGWLVRRLVGHRPTTDTVIMRNHKQILNIFITLFICLCYNDFIQKVPHRRLVKGSNVNFATLLRAVGLCDERTDTLTAYVIILRLQQPQHRHNHCSQQYTEHHCLLLLFTLVCTVYSYIPYTGQFTTITTALPIHF